MPAPYKYHEKIGTKVFVDNIPFPLTQAKHWLFWVYDTQNGRELKIPLTFKNGKLVACDAGLQPNWLEFDVVKNHLNTGVGAMFCLKDSIFWAIDFDDFSNDEEVKEILSKAGSYGEITPSGEGFRIIFAGEFPFQSDKRVLLKDGRRIEFFKDTQITITGAKISETGEIKGASEDFLKFLAEKFPELKLENDLKIEKPPTFYWAQLEEVESFKDIKLTRASSIIIIKEILNSPEGNFYVAKFSSAQPHIFIKSNKRLPLGNTEINLVPLQFSKLLKISPHLLYHVFAEVDQVMNKLNSIPLKYPIKKALIPDSDDEQYEFKELLFKKVEEFTELQETLCFVYFYEHVNPVNLALYKPKEINDVKDFLKMAMFLNGEYDPSLAKIFSAFNYEIDNENYYYMPYAPHAIIVTNTKTGKSTLARHFGQLYESLNVSPAALNGFSSADTVREGVFATSKLSIFFDELQTWQNQQKQLGAGSLDLFENGICRVEKGKAGLETKFANALVFLSNRNLIQNVSGNQAVAFLKLLLAISTNLEAVASRLGILFYNIETKPVRNKKRLRKEDLNKITQMNKALREFVSEIYLNLLENETIFSWLESEYPDFYKHEVADLSKRVQSDEIKTFMLSHLESYRHARGASLRIALYDPYILYNLLNDNIDVELILSRAEDYFAFVMSTNLNTLKVLAELPFSDFVRAKLEFWNSLNVLNDAVKILILTTRLYYEENAKNMISKTIDARDKSSPFVMFYNQKVKNIFEGISYSEKYSWLERAVSKVDNDLLSSFIGIKIEKTEEGIVIEIVDENKLLSDYLDRLSLKTTTYSLKYYYERYKQQNEVVAVPTKKEEITEKGQEKKSMKEVAAMIYALLKGEKKGLTFEEIYSVIKEFGALEEQAWQVLYILEKEGWVYKVDNRYLLVSDVSDVA